MYASHTNATDLIVQHISGCGITACLSILGHLTEWSRAHQRRELNGFIDIVVRSRWIAHIHDHAGWMTRVIHLVNSGQFRALVTAHGLIDALQRRKEGQTDELNQPKLN